jgi:hypothetical protein
MILGNIVGVRNMKPVVSIKRYMITYRPQWCISGYGNLVAS